MKEIYRIENAQWYAFVDLLHGANCIALRNEKLGIAVFREPKADGERDNWFLYGMPILFPVNRIQGGRFLFEGRQYEFPINEPATGCHLHGELHKMSFTLVEKQKERLLCRFAASKERPYLGFPHEFEILAEYALAEEGLCHTLTVINRSERNMPLLLGFHSTFSSLPFRGGKAQDIRIFAQIDEEYERRMESDFLPTGKKLPLDAVSQALCSSGLCPLGKTISRHYRGGGILSVFDVEKRLRIVYKPDEKFKFRLIYGKASEGYVCLEPQTCLVNCPNGPFSREEGGFDFLRPGEGKTYRSMIIAEEF